MLLGGNTIPVAAHQGNVGETGEDGTNQTHQNNLVYRCLFCHNFAKLKELEHPKGQAAAKTKNAFLMLNTVASFFLKA
jgi:hypothetical protein